MAVGWYCSGFVDPGLSDVVVGLVRPDSSPKGTFFPEKQCMCYSDSLVYEAVSLVHPYIARMGM